MVQISCVFELKEEYLVTSKMIYMTAQMTKESGAFGSNLHEPFDCGILYKSADGM